MQEHSPFVKIWILIIKIELNLLIYEFGHSGQMTDNGVFSLFEVSLSVERTRVSPPSSGLGCKKDMKV